MNNHSDISTCLRVGHGYDLHRLVKGRPLILGGVLIEHDTGLLGHSDADVLLHAIIDSLLGAAALGDIGRLFPPTDPAFKDISSLLLLEQAYASVKERGFSVRNIDATIVCEAPRLVPVIPEMIKNISKALGCDEDQINIKATTEEGLGATGKGEAIAAHAISLISSIFNKTEDQ
jgi:2-C-methyl-D-erythritol 2,4-cyclodiphosphate synthase